MFTPTEANFQNTELDYKRWRKMYFVFQFFSQIRCTHCSYVAIVIFKDILILRNGSIERAYISCSTSHYL